MEITIEKIRKLQSPPEKDSYYAVLFGRRISPYSTWVLVRLGIGPNIVTFISFLFIVASDFFFTSANPLYWVVGWVVLQGYHILDSSDGEIARISKSTSKFGGMFDSILHPFGNSIIFAAASIGIYNAIGDMIFIYAGFAVSICMLMFSVVRLHGALLFGKEMGSVHIKRSTIKGKMVSLLTEVGGPFLMLMVIALFDAITGLKFRALFFVVFTVGMGVMIVRKILMIWYKLKR
jgi:phosphatidylglycerophosphate synthase